MKIEHENNWDRLVIENEDDLQVFTEAHEELKRRALPIAKALLKLQGIKPKWGVDEEDIYLEGGDLYVKYDIGCCGDYDEEHVRIPPKYLFDLNWIKQATADLKEKHERERQEAERKRIEAENKKQKQEYERYLKLKDKFEGEDK